MIFHCWAQEHEVASKKPKKKSDAKSGRGWSESRSSTTTHSLAHSHSSLVDPRRLLAARGAKYLSSLKGRAFLWNCGSWSLLSSHVCNTSAASTLAPPINSTPQQLFNVQAPPISSGSALQVQRLTPPFHDRIGGVYRSTPPPFYYNLFSICTIINCL